MELYSLFCNLPQMNRGFAQPCFGGNTMRLRPGDAGQVKTFLKIQWQNLTHLTG